MMVSLRDTFILAATKLRVHRIRLVITLVVSGLLFSWLFAASFVVRGAVASLSSFTEDTFLKRFIIMAFPQTRDSFGDTILQREDIVRRANVLYENQVRQMQAEAAAQGLSFDPASVPKAVMDIPSWEPGKLVPTLDLAQPAARQALTETGYTNPGRKVIEDSTKPYHAIGIYQSRGFDTSAGNFSLNAIVNGQEQASRPVSDVNNQHYQDTLSDFGRSLLETDDGMVKPFLGRDQSFDAQPGQPVPVIAPAESAEKLVGLGPMAANASNQQRLEHLKQLRAKAIGYTLSVCYRNATALQLDQLAANQAADQAAHGKEAGYEAPALMYRASSQPCQLPSVSRDNRTPSQRQADAKLTALREKFGQPAPIATTIPFVIVGFKPYNVFENDIGGIESYAAGILTPAIGNGWTIATSSAKTNPILNAIYNNPLNGIEDKPSFFVEFANRTDQRNYLERETCQATSSDVDPDCFKVGRIGGYPYGNPIAVLYDGLKPFQAFALWAVGAVMLLCTIIMVGTIGKVIADNRHETGIFRAIGATRHQVVQIYLMYTLLLGGLVAGTSLVFGAGLAGWAELRYGPQLSTTAVLAFNTADTGKAFHLFSWYWPDVLVFVAFILLSALLGAIIPLTTNVRRSPITDMREE